MVKSTESDSEPSTSTSSSKSQLPIKPSTSTSPSPNLSSCQGRRLFVKNIGYRRRRDQLVKRYTRFFSKFGKVEYFDVIWDHIKNLPKGYAFVTFRKREGALRALSATPEELTLSSQSLRTLVVQPASAKCMDEVKAKLKQLQIDREAIAKQKSQLLEAPTTERASQVSENKEGSKNLDQEEAEAQPSNLLPVEAPLGIKTLNDLDDETLMMIFETLSARDRSRISSVCVRFYNLIDRVWASTTSLELKDSFPLWGTQTAALDSNTLFKILSRCPSLLELSLYQTNTTLDDRSCDIIGRCCPLLEKLNIRDTTLNKYCVISIGKFCSNIKSINFSKCQHLAEKGLWGLFKLRPNLLEINLNQCDTITGRCFYLLTNLTKLDVSGCLPILNNSYSRLAQNCSNTLVELKTAPISVDGLAFICKNFPNLTCLEVTQSCDQYVLNGVRSLGMLTNLEKLVFRPEMADLNDETFYYITSRWPHLRELTMFGNDQITDVSTVSLPGNCPDLRLINLEGFKFGDTTIRVFTQLSQLKSLSISGSLVSDDGVYFLLVNLPKLEALGLSSCLGITLTTLHSAHNLAKEGLINKNLVIHYSRFRIPIMEFVSDDLRRYEPDCWDSEQEDYDYDAIAEAEADGVDFLLNELDDFGDLYDNFIDGEEAGYYDDYNEEADYYDDYIVDGDFDELEEELS